MLTYVSTLPRLLFANWLISHIFPTYVFAEKLYLNPLGKKTSNCRRFRKAKVLLTQMVLMRSQNLTKFVIYHNWEKKHRPVRKISVYSFSQIRSYEVFLTIFYQWNPHQYNMTTNFMSNLIKIRQPVFHPCYYFWN